MRKFAAIAAGCTWLLCAGAQADSRAVYHQFDRFSDAYEKVRENYVRPLKDSEIMDNAISGMLSGLDPHSSYMNAKDFDAMIVNTKHDSVGVGLNITVTGAGQAKVISPIDGAPAERAGVQPGDYISEIDGVAVDDLPLNTVIRMMQGPAGSVCQMTVVRRGDENPINFSIPRGEVRNVAVKFERKGDIGYIRLSAMSENASGDVEKAISALKKGAPLKGYILDLRNDPGGLLDQAAEIGDVFLDKGNIFSTRGRHNEDTQTYPARKGDATGGKPLVVLINEGSAAGAEIVAGALQDQQRATLIGRRSFGSATIQTIIPLGEDQGALRLTTSQVYLPSGRSFQATGIEPNFVVSQTAQGPGNFERPRREAALPGHLAAGGAAPAENKVIYPEAGSADADFQLSYALDFLHKSK